MFCLACGEPDKEPNVNCVHCGQNWLEHEVDTNLKKGLEQLAKIYFISKDLESANFLEKLDKLRSKFKISSDKWEHALQAFYEYKDRLSALSGLELTFNESLQDAYAKHDTNLEFLLLNNTEDFIEAHIYWDDLDTPDELDLNIKTYEAIAPEDTVLLSGEHVFARAGRKTITDLTLTIKNFEGEEVQFTVAPFKIDIEISPENITQQNINKISVKGRNVVDASNVSQNSKSKNESKESWLHLKLIPNTNGLIESLAGSNAKEIASSKSSASEDIRDPMEPLERKMHINTDGNKNKDFYREFEDHILDILEKNRKKTSESEASLFPEIDLTTMNSWSKKIKAVSKIPDHDYPVFDKPYYEEYPDGEIKHFRLPMMAKFSNVIDTTSEECISFFYDKVESLGIGERTRAINSANYPDQRILRIAWGTETATDRFSVVYISEDSGDTFEQIYFVHDLKDHHWSTIIEVTAPGDEPYCYQSAFSSRDLPISDHIDYQYSNGYIDKLTGKFRTLPSWSRIYDVQSEFYPKEMSRLADCDKKGYNEDVTKVSKLRQWGNEGVLHEHFPYLKIYPQFDRRSITGEITMGAKINDHFVGLAEQFEFLYVYRSDGKYHYEIALNNAIGLNLEKINCMSATIAQISEPLEDLSYFKDTCRGYIKTYYMFVIGSDGMEILPECGVGFASSISILVDETSSQTDLIKNELIRWSQNRNGLFSHSIQTPMFFIWGMENDDDIKLGSPFWEDNYGDEKISPEIFSFIGSKQANGSRNYFSNPESIVLRALQKIKEIEAGRPAFKLLDQVTAYRSSVNDHHKREIGDMLDNAKARKQFLSKPGKLSWTDLGNVWIDPS